MLDGAFKKDDGNGINYKDYHTWLNFGICSDPTTLCYFGNCNKCPGFDRLRPILQEYYDKNNIEILKYSLWTTTDRSTMETKLEPVDDFIENLITRLPRLLQHSFITKQQNLYFNHIKENLKLNEFLVVLDFSENYTFTIQDEIQAYHWTNEQATIHPFGIYHRTEEKVEFSNVIIISDITKHNTAVVNLFIEEFIQYIKENFESPEKILNM